MQRLAQLEAYCKFAIESAAVAVSACKALSRVARLTLMSYWTIASPVIAIRWLPMTMTSQQVVAVREQCLYVPVEAHSGPRIGC